MRRYLDLDEILYEEERLPCEFTREASGLGYLDSTCSSVNLPELSTVELPLWLAEKLSDRGMVNMKLPKHYGARIREDILAGAEAVKLREYSYYYFEVGLKLSHKTNDEDLRTTLRAAFAGQRYKSLVSRAQAHLHEDMADYTHSLTASELQLFQAGYESTRAIHLWRSGKSSTLLPASVLISKGNDESDERTNKRQRNSVWLGYQYISTAIPGPGNWLPLMDNVFLLDRTDEEEEKEDDGVDSQAKRHQAHQEQKRLRTTKPTMYRCLKHIYSTTNCVERLFSRAKINMSDLRKSMAPHRLEALMFLRFNRYLWNASTVEDAIRACNE